MQETNKNPKYLILKLICIFILSNILCSCSKASKVEQPEDLPSSRELCELIKNKDLINTFHIKGKLSFKSSEEGGNANFEWLHTISTNKITFYDPLGNFVLEINQNENNIEAKDSKGNIVKANSIDEISYAITKVHIPYNLLVYWLKGSPAPSYHWQINSFDTANNISSLTQIEWQLKFTYKDKNPIFPSKIEIINTVDDLKIKFIIKKHL